jgi:hypothetical protein
MQLSSATNRLDSILPIFNARADLGRLTARPALVPKPVAPQLRETGTPRIPAQRSSLLEYGTAWHRTNQLFITIDMDKRGMILQRLNGMVTLRWLE